MYVGQVSGQRRAIKSLWVAGPNPECGKETVAQPGQPSAVALKRGRPTDRPAIDGSERVCYLVQVASIASSLCSQASTRGISRPNSAIRA